MCEGELNSKAEWTNNFAGRQRPLLGVVIPAYNCEKCIEQAVKSICNQPCEDIMVIVVDDGSTDSTLHILRTLAEKDPRIHVLHQENAGVSAARNRGIEYALDNVDDCTRGGYITFLDADDFWCSGVITDSLLKTMWQDENVDVYAFGSTLCNQEASRFSYPETYEDGQCEGKLAIWKMKGTFAACLYSVRLFRKWGIQFQTGLRYAEDKIFRMQCVFLAEKVVFLPTVLYVYRNNKVSAMSKVKKMSSIEYFGPIINGWIQSDDFVNSRLPEGSPQIKAGYVLAGIYFMDMAADHYKSWGKRAELQKVFQEHPYFNLFVHMQPQDVSSRQYKDHNLLLNRPGMFQLKYNLVGVVEATARYAIKLPWLAEWWERRKYPVCGEN